MKNAVIGILGFALGILVFATINKGNLFTDASESGSALIEQLDGILSSAKFDNREYSLSIIDKADALSDIFEEDSMSYLAMKYISVKLTSKVKAMPAPVAKEAMPVEDHNTAVEAKEENEVTEKTTTNSYKNGFTLPKKEEKAAAPTGKAANLDGFNVGRQAIPKTAVKSTRKTVSDTHTYEYMVDGDLYNFDCAQMRCVETCLNLKAGYAESLCKKECVSDVCVDVKLKGKLAGRKIATKGAADM